MLHPALCFYCGAWSKCTLFKCPRCGCRSGLICKLDPMRAWAFALSNQTRRAVRDYLAGGPDRRFTR